MPRVIEKTVYQFNELSDKAKERARAWYRGADDDSFWEECVLEDAAQCAEILGISIKKNGIYYSGFWSQGDGASFVGSYAYKKGAAKAIRDHAPQDTTLHEIADSLQEAQRVNFYGAECTITHRGHYQHSGCMSFDWENPNRPDVLREEDSLTQPLRNFADWIYSQLEQEYKYQNANAQVDESILANGYEFTSEGECA